MALRIEYKPPALSFAQFHTVDAECFPDEPVDSPTLEAFLRQDLWAAWDSTQLVGYCAFHRKPTLIWLRRLAVTQSHRRQGIGRSLMTEAVERGRQIGIPNMMLYVQEGNDPAMRLYESFGFRKVATTCQYIVPISTLHKLTQGYSGVLLQAQTIDQVPPEAMPPLPEEWADIARVHDPPNQYVFVFRDSAGSIVGYTRLTPGFPGCFPFFISEPGHNLIGALRVLEAYLLPEKDVLKLTFTDSALEAKCSSLGFQLNYRLFRMNRTESY